MRQPLGESTVLWVGVFGAPAAWVLQHLIGYSLTEARCDAGLGGPSLDLDAWTIAVTAVAAIVAVVAIAAAIVTFRSTRDAEDEPTRARIHYLAVIAITIGPLFLAMILMSGLGVVFLPHCVQS